MHEVRILQPEPRREHSGVGSSERDPSGVARHAEFARGVRDESRGVGERLGGGEVAEGRDGEVARGLGGPVEPVFEGEDERAAARRHLDRERAVRPARGHHRRVKRRALAADAEEHQRRVGGRLVGGRLVSSRRASRLPVRVVGEVALIPRSRLEAVEVVEGLDDPSLRGEGRGRRGRGRRVDVRGRRVGVGGRRVGVGGRRVGVGGRRVDEPPRAEVRPQRRGTTREAPVRMGRNRRDARGKRGGDERRHARQRRRATRGTATATRHPDPEPDVREASARARRQLAFHLVGAGNWRGVMSVVLKQQSSPSGSTFDLRELFSRALRREFRHRDSLLSRTLAPPVLASVSRESSLPSRRRAVDDEYARTRRHRAVAGRADRYIPGGM